MICADGEFCAEHGRVHNYVTADQLTLAQMEALLVSMQADRDDWLSGRTCRDCYTTARAAGSCRCGAVRA